MSKPDYIKQLQASAKKRAEVVRLHKKGKKNAEIANVLDISHQRVSQILASERVKGNVP